MKFKSYEISSKDIAACQIIDGITWKGGLLAAAQTDATLADAIEDDFKGLLLLDGVRMRRARPRKKISRRTK